MSTKQDNSSEQAIFPVLRSAESETKKSWSSKISNFLISRLINSVDSRDLSEHIFNQKEGKLQDEVSRLLRRTLKIDSTKCRDIMTPRAQVEELVAEAPIEDVLTFILEQGYSRFPVVSSEDKVLGMVVAKDLWEALYWKKDGEQLSLLQFIRPIVTVPESKKVLTLLHELRQKRISLAAVIDEYGQFSGLVSVEDIVEELVGEIEDEHDEVINNIRPVKGKLNTFILSALMPVIEFNNHFNASLGLDTTNKTISGWLLDKLGVVPKINDEITEGKFIFKVVSGNARRIEFLQVKVVNALDKFSDKQDM